MKLGQGDLAKQVQIDQLKLEIEKTFGRRILSSADCNHLCTDIAYRTRQRISFNTLRRYFNLMKASHNPSFYTLDVLSNYCGFSSFQDFINFQSQRTGDENGQKDPGLVNYLIQIFRNTEAAGRNDTTFQSLVHQTILYLEQYPGYIDEFQREVSRTKNGQEFYYEQFINIDKLNSFYGEGLRYYLNEKNTFEAQVFGHALLAFRDWLTMNDKEVTRHLKVIMSQNVDGLHPFICALSFSSKLLCGNVIGLTEDQVITEARKYYYFHSHSYAGFSSYYCFEIVMAEALILTGQFEEAMFYLDGIMKRIKNSVASFFDESLLETIYLFKAIVFAYTGRKSKAKEIQEQINPNKFYFLSKKYLSILYYSLNKMIRNRNSETEQINFLVNETGFIRLLNLWEAYYPALEENQE